MLYDELLNKAVQLFSQSKKTIKYGKSINV